MTLNNVDRATLYFRDWRYLTGERRAELVKSRAQYERFLRQLILATYEEEGRSTTIDLKHLSLFVIGGTNWVADWFKLGGPDSAQQVADEYTELAMAAIFGVAKH